MTKRETKRARKSKPLSDRQSSRALVREALEDVDSDRAWSATAIIHHRGSREEFNLATALAASRVGKERKLAARILGQLGHQRRSFHAESVDLLIRLLRDRSPNVVSAAAIALAHRSDLRAVPHLLDLRRHANPKVRYGVAVGLGGFENDDAVSALIELSSDSDIDVRNWATFGLASLTDWDSKEVRSVLLARASDEIPEIRGEALIGLARRKDARVGQLLRSELRKPFEGDWAIEAAGLLGSRALRADLQALWKRMSVEEQRQFRRTFDSALKSCKATVPPKQT